MPTPSKTNFHLPLLFNVTDEKVKELTETQIKPPCKDGCDGCCHQVVYIDTVEAMELAVELKNNSESIGELRYKMQNATRVWNQHKRDKVAMFRAGVPCVLLDRKNKRCSAYERRPSACRLYFVSAETDPKDCVPPGSPKITFITMTALQNHIYEYHARIAREMGLPYVIGFIADMIDAALFYLETSSHQEFARIIHEARSLVSEKK